MKKLYRILFFGGGGGAIFRGAIFLGCIFPGAIFRGTIFLGGLFPGVNFPGVTFPGGIFPSTKKVIAPDILDHMLIRDLLFLCAIKQLGSYFDKLAIVILKFTDHFHQDQFTTTSRLNMGVSHLLKRDSNIDVLTNNT